MFWNKRVWPEELSDVVWYDANNDAWINRELYVLWLAAMKSALDMLGMHNRYQQLFAEKGHGKRREPPVGLVHVDGWRNRQLLKETMNGVAQSLASPLLVVETIRHGKALRINGDMTEAVEIWTELMRLVRKSTVTAIATQALQYYVEGTQVGYPPNTRHLLSRRNNVKQVGDPGDLAWEFRIAGHKWTIHGDWEHVKKIAEEQHLSVLQQVQLQLNDVLVKLAAKG